MAKKVRITKRTSDEDLLNTRICDLDLSLDGSKVERCIWHLDKELAYRDIKFRPHFWLSDEFFTPDGIPGIAIPFYLAHPRLERLEKSQMFEAEGSSFQECMKILRHELGHAIDHAYRLTRRKKRQKIFGKTTAKYPDIYTPKPYSKSFVVHLDNWYAQAHPDEDFAETFAVWFRLGNRWKRRYRGWPAAKKLQYMEELMEEVKDKTPLERSRATEYRHTQIHKTLAQYYEEKKERFGLNTKEDFYDRDLLKLFTNDPKFETNPKAARFIRKIRKEARRSVAFGTGQYRYAIDEVIEEIIDRCEELDLRLLLDEDETRSKFLVTLTVQTMNYLHSGGYSLAM